MKEEHFKTLDKFIDRVRPIINFKSDRPVNLKVNRSEAKALYHYEKDYGGSFYGFAYIDLKIVSGEVGDDIQQAIEDVEYSNQILSGIYNLSVQRDIDKWPKRCRQAIKISQTEMNHLLRMGEINSDRCIYGENLYTREEEIEMVPVPTVLRNQIQGYVDALIPMIKQ